jgi:DNA-binding NarL/FixJ family response regulator
VRNYFQSFFGSPPPTEEPSKAEGLTQREQEIFHHMSKGYLDKEIAHNLNLSIWTVHNHVKHIYEKLKVHNRTEAVLRYLQK